MHRIGFPILIIASRQVPETNVLVVEWFLFIAPLRGKIDRMWMDRVVYEPDPDAPPVEPNAPAINLALLCEAAKSTAKRVLSGLQDNGLPFTSNSVTHLIYHGSTKHHLTDSDPIGQFGTGFLTTHLISKTVTVKGIFEGGKHFSFLLDRRGDSPEESFAGNGQVVEGIC